MGKKKYFQFFPLPSNTATGVLSLGGIPPQRQSKTGGQNISGEAF